MYKRQVRHLNVAGNFIFLRVDDEDAVVPQLGDVGFFVAQEMDVARGCLLYTSESVPEDFTGQVLGKDAEHIICMSSTRYANDATVFVNSIEHGDMGRGQDVYKRQTDQVVDELKVGIQPTSLVMDKYNKMWTVTDGGYEGSP